MARLRPRGSGIFNGLILIAIGLVWLIYNYRGFDFAEFIKQWWPLILILWGAVKIYERTAGARSSGPGAARISSSEVLMVVALLALVAIVVGIDQGRKHLSGMDIDLPGETFASSIDVPTKPVPANARVTVRGGRGDISVRASDEAEIRVSGKVNVKSWNENMAKRLSERVSAEVVQNGDGFEIRPTGAGGNSRVSVDLDISVPKKALLAIHNEKGDVNVSDIASQVSVDNGNGDIEVRGTGGDVSVDMRHGDAKISDTKGDVRISGRGGSIEVVNATGSLTLNGEFVGPVRADKVAKGVRFVSHRTDLTLTQLSGHMEASSGNLEVVDAPGNLIVRSRDEDINIENAGGKVTIDDRNGNVQVRFSSPPKEDVQITNSSAAINLTLPEASSFEILADCHRGDIDSEFESDTLKKTSTDSGDSHLEGKYGSGRGPKITLKTTYGSISIHKTS